MLAQRFDQKGKVIILSETTDEPLTLAGGLAGICWGADTKDNKKNFDRGLECLHNGHGRVLEYPQIFMVLDGWSARVIREFYTHIAGGPTRLQASTRYINYSDFNYVTPPNIKNHKMDDPMLPTAEETYAATMENIAAAAEYLEKDLGIKREDVGMLLPLGMETKIVVRTNLRHLIDMSRVRLCTRAYWEFRELFKAIMEALSIYSDEWKYLIEEEKIFRPKCEFNGYCEEKYTCGHRPSAKDFSFFAEAAVYCHQHGYKPEQVEIQLHPDIEKYPDKVSQTLTVDKEKK